MEQSTNFAHTTIPPVQYAGFGIRFLAYWVDFLILFPLGLIIQQMTGNSPFAIFEAQSLSDLQKIQASSSSLLGMALSIPVSLAFFLVFWVNYDGATPGKKLLGIKIVKDNGEKLTYPVAFIRLIGYLVSAATVFFFGIGYLWIIWDKKKQALHDKIASTVVVKTDKPPRIGLALLLTVVAFFLFFGYIGAAMFKGLQLGMQQLSNESMDSYPALSLEQNRERLSSEAKVHYDKTQDLFKQMRTVINDPAAIKPLADQTIKEAKLAIEAQPDNPILWSNLGDAYGWPNTTGTAEDALDAYRKAEELDPNNVVYSNFVGDQLIRTNRNGEAVLQFQKSLRITDSSGYAHVSIGKAYKNLKVYDAAREHLQRGIEIFQSENKDGKYDTEILEAQKELSSLPK